MRNKELTRALSKYHLACSKTPPRLFFSSDSAVPTTRGPRGAFLTDAGGVPVPLASRESCWAPRSDLDAFGLAAALCGHRPPQLCRPGGERSSLGTCGGRAGSRGGRHPPTEEQASRMGSAGRASDRLARPAGRCWWQRSLPVPWRPLLQDGRPARRLSLFMWLPQSWFPAKAVGAVGTLTPASQSSYSLWFPPKVAKAQFSKSRSVS